MKGLWLYTALAAIGTQSAPTAQVPPPTLQAPSSSDDSPLIPFELGASPVPFGPKPVGCSKLELIIGS